MANSRIISVKNNAVTAFEKQTEGQKTQGWLHLEEVVTYVKRTSPIRTQLVTETRHCPLNGDMDALEKQVAGWKATGIPGRIIVTELLESELPKGFVDNAKDLDSYVKVAGDTKIPCVLEGERIFRFSNYSEDETEVDKLIAHDNGEFIRAEGVVLREKAEAKKAAEVMEIADLGGKK